MDMAVTLTKRVLVCLKRLPEGSALSAREVAAIIREPYKRVRSAVTYLYDQGFLDRVSGWCGLTGRKCLRWMARRRK